MLSSPPLAGQTPPAVHVGSHTDARHLRDRIQALLRGVERAGEQLGLLLETAREKAIWAMLTDASGRYFVDWLGFVTAAQPFGLGITEATLGELVRAYRDPARLARRMLESPVELRHPGDNRPNPTTWAAAGTAGDTAGSTRRGFALTGNSYWAARLKRDRPDLLQQVIDGELPGVEAAAIAAGFAHPKVTVQLTITAFARVLARHFTAAERAEIFDLAAHPERLPNSQDRSAARRRYEASLPPDVRAERAAQREALAAAKRAREAAHKRAQRAARVVARTVHEDSQEGAAA